MRQDEAQQAETERYEQVCDAINNCAKAGADIESIRTLCREAGVDIKHTILGDEIRPRRVG